MTTKIYAEGEILTGGQSEKSLSADILLAEVSKTFSLFEKVGLELLQKKFFLLKRPRTCLQQVDYSLIYTEPSKDKKFFIYCKIKGKLDGNFSRVPVLRKKWDVTLRNIYTDSECCLSANSIAVENIINLWSAKRPLKCPPLCDLILSKHYLKVYNVSKLKTVLEVRGHLSFAPITPSEVQA